MKRAPELLTLSHQHHSALVVARHLRLAAAGERPLEAAAAEFLEAWEREIHPHFVAEEEVLLPPFARAAGAEDSLIRRTDEEHAALRAAARALREGPAGTEEVRELGQALEAHIRFEERVLFPAVEAALDSGTLAEVAAGLEKAAEGIGSYCRGAAIHPLD
jgi:iron-sulfur cluster repair protein YtfE (RIC family)